MEDQPNIFEVRAQLMITLLNHSVTQLLSQRIHTYSILATFDDAQMVFTHNQMVTSLRLAHYHPEMVPVIRGHLQTLRVLIRAPFGEVQALEEDLFIFLEEIDGWEEEIPPLMEDASDEEMK